MDEAEILGVFFFEGGGVPQRNLFFFGGVGVGGGQQNPTIQVEKELFHCYNLVGSCEEIEE